MWRYRREKHPQTRLPSTTSSLMFPRSHLWLNESDQELVSLLRLSQAIDIYWCPFTFLTFWVEGNPISRLTLSFFYCRSSSKAAPRAVIDFSVLHLRGWCCFNVLFGGPVAKILSFLFQTFDSYISAFSLTLCVSDSPFHFSIFFL